MTHQSAVPSAFLTAERKDRAERLIAAVERLWPQGDERISRRLAHARQEYAAGNYVQACHDCMVAMNPHFADEGERP